MAAVRFILLILFKMALEQTCCSQDETCLIRNTAFRSGEEIKYTVSYNWFIFWTDIGEVTFTASKSKIFDKPCLHLLGTGKTYKNWDWFFKVRDRYESWVHPVTLKPYFFNRSVSEGGYNFNIRYIFNRNRGYALSTYKREDKPEKKDTVDITGCTFDVISILYYARNIDYSGYKTNDTIPVTILLDNQLENIYFRYQGTEKIKIRQFGEFECIRLSVFLVAGSVFRGGEYMSIWVTNDRNHIPLYVETPIIVGSVKAKIESVKGNKYKLDSEIK